MRQLRKILKIAACHLSASQGTPVLIRHVAAAHARSQHSIHIVSYGNHERATPPTISSVEPYVHHTAPPVPLRLQSGPQWLKPLADLTLLSHAHRLLRTHAFDVIYAHHIEALAIGIILKIIHRRPLIYHAHTALSFELPTYFKTPMLRWASALLGTRVDKIVPRCADRVVVFDDVQRELHRAWGVPSHRIHVIPAAIDNAEVQSHDPETLRKFRRHCGAGPFVLYAGNADGYQNLSLLWQAFAQVRRHRSDCRLLIATSETPKRFIESMGGVLPPEAFTIYQHKTLDELKALFAIADVGACPRSLIVGTPIKVLNYRAAGLPVVSRETLAPLPLTADTFARGLLNALDQPKHSHPAPSIDTQMPLYETIYDDLLSPFECS